MSKGELLYFKGMNMAESEQEESEEEDIWDDSKLTAAYDKAVSMANAEIARRVAMSTNNKSKTESIAAKSEGAGHSKTSKKNKSSKHHSHKDSGSAMKWKAGMACTAVYDCDGVEYEAFILRMINNEECVVRFLGYENSEIVAISSLKPSLGKEVRAKQIQEALEFTATEDVAHNIPETVQNPVTPKDGETMEMESDRIHSEASSGSHHRKKKSSRKKKHNRSSFDLPPVGSLPMPTMADFMNVGVPEMPMPPPPGALPLAGGACSCSGSSSSAALSSMLLSWYMSGYCTGYYQGITREKESKRKN